MRRVLTVTCLLAIAAGLSIYVSAQGKAVEMPMSQVKWEPAGPGSPIQLGILWGDRNKGPEYAMLLKLPAGTEAGWHSHTAAYHAVAVQGTWVHTSSKEGKPIELGPGGHVMQPGKIVHNDACKGSTDCIIFIHQHAAGDMIPAK
jgi:quercetin dioxygenase-like cupin family protein